MKEHSEKVEQFRKGNEKLLGFFVGQCMKNLPGIDGNYVKNSLLNCLNNS